MPYEMLTQTEVESIRKASNQTLDEFHSRLFHPFDEERLGKLQQGCVPLTEEEKQYALVYKEMRVRGIWPDESLSNFRPRKPFSTKPKSSHHR